MRASKQTVARVVEHRKARDAQVAEYEAQDTSEDPVARWYSARRVASHYWHDVRHAPGFASEPADYRAAIEDELYRDSNTGD